MPGLADLISPGLLTPGAQTPVLMAATVLDASPLRVTIPDLDGGKHAFEAFGHWPDAQEGDEMRVMIDHQGGAVAVAWEPSS